MTGESDGVAEGPTCYSKRSRESDRVKPAESSTFPAGNSDKARALLNRFKILAAFRDKAVALREE